MNNLHKITKPIIAFAAIAVALLLAGCASAPEQRDKPKEDAKLDLYGVLYKKDGQYSVAGFCRKSPAPLPDGASLFGSSCPMTFGIR